jgi:hypothetical protein
MARISHLIPNRNETGDPFRRISPIVAAANDATQTPKNRELLPVCPKVRRGNGTIFHQVGSRPKFHRVEFLFHSPKLNGGEHPCWRVDSEKLRGFFDYPSLLFGLELRVHGQRKDF